MKRVQATFSITIVVGLLFMASVLGEDSTGIFIGLSTEYFVADGCVGTAALRGWPMYSIAPI